MDRVLITLWVGFAAVVGYVTRTLVVDWARATASGREALHAVRIQVFPDFWKAVKPICTPSEENAIRRADLEKAKGNLAEVYHASGVFLDPNSRVFAIYLRERLAAAERETQANSDGLKWDDDEWPKLWIAKTAFRICLARALDTPRPFKAGSRWRRDVFKVDTRGMFAQLQRKMTIVETLADGSRSTQELRELIREQLQRIAGTSPNF